EAADARERLERERIEAREHDLAPALDELAPELDERGGLADAARADEGEQRRLLAAPRAPGRGQQRERAREELGRGVRRQRAARAAAQDLGEHEARELRRRAVLEHAPRDVARARLEREADELPDRKRPELERRRRALHGGGVRIEAEIACG